MPFKSSASFPDGWSDGGSLAEAKHRLVGRRIVDVGYPSSSEIEFTLDDGSTLTLTPAGLEGDDLGLTIADAA